MLCPFCACESRVTRTQTAPDHIRRRRKCQGCAKSFGTIEQLSLTSVRVAKAGKRGFEEFDLRKIIRVVKRVAKGCAFSGEEIEGVAHRVRAEIFRLQQPVVSTGRIAQLLIDQLEIANALAASRLAANYRNSDGKLVFPEVVLRRPEPRQFSLFDAEEASLPGPH